jgi:hypothetical protein
MKLFSGKYLRDPQSSRSVQSTSASPAALQVTMWPRAFPPCVTVVELVRKTRGSRGQGKEGSPCQGRNDEHGSYRRSKMELFVPKGVKI